MHLLNLTNGATNSLYWEVNKQFSVYWLQSIVWTTEENKDYKLCIAPNLLLGWKKNRTKNMVDLTNN